MTPETRREASIAHLKNLGVAVSPALPLIEDDGEVIVRDPEDLLRRLVALWAVAGAANLPEVRFFREFIQDHDLSNWLSSSESDFLFSESPSDQQRVHFSWQIEPMYFLGWCGGLVPQLVLPRGPSSVEAMLPLFPNPNAPDLTRLRAALVVRPKVQLMDWADLLYRTHSALREAQLHCRDSPASLVPGAVMEWHKSVNWMTCHEGEDDWDHVATDT